MRPARYRNGVRIPAPNLDPGVRLAVAQLNGIDGVTTRASCEGHGTTDGGRHSDLAYVAFEYPLPPRFQAFLIEALEMFARVEDDAIYSRWPESNGDFLENLERAARRYRVRQRRQKHPAVRCRLTKLRSRLATRVMAGREATASICLECRGLVVGPHACGGRAMRLLSWPAGSQATWFGSFLAEPGNDLGHDVAAVLGNAELERRARRGDFGVHFRRRWLRYRNDTANREITRSLRAGVEALRRTGSDLDVRFDAEYAHFTWKLRREA
jgi:hypothetical protein